MMFSDVDIRNSIVTEEIRIDPFDEDSLTPVGYDLRVGEQGYITNRGEKVKLKEVGRILLRPGDTINIYTLESLELARRIGGMITAIVSLSFEGLSHISTTVDPTWKGNLLIQTHNYSNKEIPIIYGERLCTICFFEMKSESQKVLDNSPSRLDLRQRLDEAVEKYRLSPSTYKVLEGKAEKIAGQMLALHQELNQLSIQLDQLREDSKGSADESDQG